MKNNKNPHVLIDYIYLDDEEWKRFSQVGHEYLIEVLIDRPNNKDVNKIDELFHQFQNMLIIDCDMMIVL